MIPPIVKGSQIWAQPELSHAAESVRWDVEEEEGDSSVAVRAILWRKFESLKSKLLVFTLPISRSIPASAWFASSGGAILIITGAAKVWSAFGDAKVLTIADPIVGISFKQVMLIVGVAEVAIAAVCLFSKAHRLAAMLVAWMATCFLVYRLGLLWIGWKKPCSCLGNLTDALHISPYTADILIKVLLAYLLIGSYGVLIGEWRRQRLRVQRVEG